MPFETKIDVIQQQADDKAEAELQQYDGIKGWLSFYIGLKIFGIVLLMLAVGVYFYFDIAGTNVFSESDHSQYDIMLLVLEIAVAIYIVYCLLKKTENAWGLAVMGEGYYFVSSVLIILLDMVYRPENEWSWTAGYALWFFYLYNSRRVKATYKKMIFTQQDIAIFSVMLILTVALYSFNLYQ